MMTYHCKERAKERAKLNPDQAERMINRALSKGKTYDDFKGKERQFLLRKTTENTCAIYYAGYCFIIGMENACITMFPVPHWFGKKRVFIGKEEVRNIHKYYNNFPDSRYFMRLYKEA